jgi:hypothetical protein
MKKEFYLSFQSYKEIKEENGDAVHFDFNECMKYFDFCIEHGFMYYGFYSNEPLEKIYWQLKQFYA